MLGAYQFLEYKHDGKPTKLAKVSIIGDGGADVRAALTRGSLIADAVVWARDLINQPAQAKPPVEIAADTKRLLRGRGVTVQVLDVPQLREQRLGGVLGVGQGSTQTPRFLKLTYAPAGARGKPPRLRRQGSGVRLRWPVAQDRRGHGDDEVRHVGRRGGGRRDVGAAGPRREDQGHRLRARWSRTCRVAPRSARATCSASATARRSRCSTPTPKAASSSPTRCRSRPRTSRPPSSTWPRSPAHVSWRSARRSPG